MLLEKEGNLLHEAEPRCGSKASAMIRSGFGPRLTAGDEPLDEPRLAAPAHSPPSSTSRASARIGCRRSLAIFWSSTQAPSQTLRSGNLFPTANIRLDIFRPGTPK